MTGDAGAPNGGIDSGNWPIADFAFGIDLQISGTVLGGGGKGGAGACPSNGTNGGTGGDAIACRLPMDVVVNSGGVVRGGGGGGGGGG